MMLSLFVLTVFVAVLVDGNAVRNVATSEYESNAERTDDLDFKERIYRGNEAKLGQFKSTVAISYRTRMGVGQCTGTIISPQWVLTAAHCLPCSYLKQRYNAWSNIFEYQPKMTVKLGCVNNEDSSCIEHEVEEYFSHEQAVTKTTSGECDETWGWNIDIALLKIKDKIQFSNTVGSSALLNEPMPHNISHCVAQGFGIHKYAFPNTIENPDGILRYVNLNAGNAQFCRDVYFAATYHYLIVKPNDVCAYNYNDSAKTTCRGDSGSALLCPAKGGSLTVVGVLHSGFTSCGHVDKPPLSFYTSISVVTQWVRENTNEDPDIHFNTVKKQ